jgi:hypothetical protein
MNRKYFTSFFFYKIPNNLSLIFQQVFLLFDFSYKIFLLTTGSFLYSFLAMNIPVYKMNQLYTISFRHKVKLKVKMKLLKSFFLALFAFITLQSVDGELIDMGDDSSIQSELTNKK